MLHIMIKKKTSVISEKDMTMQLKIMICMICDAEMVMGQISLLLC